MKDLINFNWRIAWYSVLIWVMAFLVGGLVILPWFYLTLPVVILLTTIFYFRRTEVVRLLAGKRIRKSRDNIFALGLGVSLVWFFILALLSVLELVGFYYFNFWFYFSDPRNWFLFPLILLMPVIYSLILENRKQSGHRRQRGRRHGSILLFR